ncbi:MULTISPECIES: type II toxin-antitoxin system antitoxin CcdA [Providencia]|uniref:type II toxin-antitoxin system antitoxin CcdA n=1 Tax=Providencia TaxID=586 RepID=UPI001B37828B|nr:MULTISPECIES: type II toxin-antitoxin system antitoxin CcdA [Providencia]UNJ79913.1 CcdA protein (antitoxin to CcdB) [Providencia sp.]EHZ7765970.1 type II toxin-antitoxin system antitoxin CcdA [Providencia rettgeri]EIJ7169112.1 type II toxin-antitoxin system antitoxin CcdA [Providencia rettgeri]EJD6048621.1 type II toxin-antitoxin system antitoxin CcdA [Providencia rettgeri]EJD6477707.1 type II toxin-antitoxin system antitoxin CcdA [Providencia rettgeri]
MKHRISVTVDKENYQLLSSSGINISGIVNDAMRKEANKLKRERWKADNREGMEEVANFIAQYGSFADENRNW